MCDFVVAEFGDAIPDRFKDSLSALKQQPARATMLIPFIRPFLGDLASEGDKGTRAVVSCIGRFAPGLAAEDYDPAVVDKLRRYLFHLGSATGVRDE